MDLTKEMSEFADENKDFRDFVLKTAKAYGKTCADVLRMKTTYYVYKEYKGGVNATRGKRED